MIKIFLTVNEATVNDNSTGGWGQLVGGLGGERLQLRGQQRHSARVRTQAWSIDCDLAPEHF